MQSGLLMQFNIPWHVEKKRIDSLESFMGRTLRNGHVFIIHCVQQSIISDLTRCQPMFSTLPSLSFFSLHSILPRKGGGREKARGGRFPAYFLLPLYPCPVYFILEIPVEASTGNTEPDLKSPSPASLNCLILV